MKNETIVMIRAAWKNLLTRTVRYFFWDPGRYIKSSA